MSTIQPNYDPRDNAQHYPYMPSDTSFAPPPSQIHAPTFHHLTSSVHSIPPPPMYIPPGNPYQQPPNAVHPGMAVAGPSYVPLIPFPTVMQESHYAPPPSGPWSGGVDWEDHGDYGDGQEFMYGSLEVKHRRRTTPEQLKVLEHWFDVNPKPDNHLREWLALELGMTKRNVQVWFQNRRAKVKGLAIKEKAAAAKVAQEASRAETATTPENLMDTPPNTAPPALIRSQPTPSPENPAPTRPPPHTTESQPQIGLLPPVNGVNMGRRVSLANGEVAKIEMYLAKQRNLARKAGADPARQPGFISPVRSPVMPGQANWARRTSIPYPAPMDGSPKISPSVRPAPSALHLAAMRNNSRRASMPGNAQVQLISSGPFTPPRVVSQTHQVPPVAAGAQPRDVAPIKEHDEDQMPNSLMFQTTDLSTTFITPPSSTYLPNTSPAYPDTASTLFDYSYDASQPFTPTGPLPNPAFSFGSVSAGPNVVPSAEEYFATRGRLGSIASINTYTTEGGTTADGSDWGSDFAAMDAAAEQDGFDPDTRRASAPADLLHDLGILGIHTNNMQAKFGNPLRPSPLGPNFAQEQSIDMMTSLSGHELTVPSTTPPHSAFSTGNPSPTKSHQVSHSMSSFYPSTSFSDSTSVSPLPSTTSSSTYANEGMVFQGLGDGSGLYSHVQLNGSLDHNSKDDFSFYADLSGNNIGNNDAVNVIV